MPVPAACLPLSGDLLRTGLERAQSVRWVARQQPTLLEASLSGVYAAGDVGSALIKRAVSAVGGGTMAVQFVHEYLKGRM